MQTVQASVTAPAPLLAQPAPRLVTKGDFARLIGVTPGRVSQYLAEGKIHGAAIVGQGRSASINPDVACQQLGVTLDAVQLSAQMRPAPAMPAPSVETPEAPLALNDAQQRHLLARAERAEIDARRAKREEEAQKGVYVRADDSTREWARSLTDLLASLDELMPAMGDALAAEFRIDPKEASVVLRRELRGWRQRQATAAAQKAEAEPKLVDDVTEDEAEGDA